MRQPLCRSARCARLVTTMRARLSVLFAAIFLAAYMGVTACGGSSSSSSNADASTNVADDGGSAGDGASGRYTQGVYSCCAEGEGKSCCPPETLPDPAKGRTATCFQYGGTAGECVAAGGTLEAKDICSICCPGLSRIELDAPSADGGACESAAPPSLFVCAACGDGTCGRGENRCNCPADCK